VARFGKMARGLFENLATAYATPQNLKGVMSIAVEKRILTATRLSGDTLLSFESGGKGCALSGGGS
jgi:hypothetical protein